jgi:hypothetical protein
MTFGLLEWALVGLGLMAGSRMLRKWENKTNPHHAINKHIPVPMPTKHPEVGDYIYMANASPYAYEPDGNLI